MTAVIVQLPVTPKRRRKGTELSEVLLAAMEAERTGAIRCAVVYEKSDGTPGYVFSLGVSPIHGRALFEEAVSMIWTAHANASNGDE